MKLLFDLLPVVLFFIAFKLSGIYVATAVAIVTSIAQIAWLKLTGRRVEGMQWAGLIIICVFGGMTLLLHDEGFIKLKPTILYAVFALSLVVSRYAMKRNLIATMMGKQIHLSAQIWDRLNWAWIGFFVAMAALNIYVANTFPTETWVNFKVFGAMGLTIGFVVAQAVYLSRHMQEGPTQR
jgi:intracellular septation protein